MTGCVNCNHRTNFSNVVSVNRGVPQGSILGPILFLIFANDLNKKVNITSLYQFADDTSCIISSADKTVLSKRSTEIAAVVLEWCNENSLVLNTGKTSLVLFRNNNSESLYVPISGKSIEQTRTVKFLGVTLDEGLQWTEQVSDVVGKISKAGFAIRVLREQVSLNIIRIFYMASVQSIIAYSIMFWYRFSVENVHRVFVAQKRIVRIMLGMNCRESCRGKFKLLNIMTVPSIFIYTCALFVRSNLNMFVTNGDLSHDVVTRGRNNLAVPIHRTALFHKGPLISCIKIFNSLPDNIRAVRNRDCFKRHLREFLIAGEFYELEAFLN